LPCGLRVIGAHVSAHAHITSEAVGVPIFTLRTIEESIFSAFSGLAGDVKILGLNKH